MTQWGLDTLFNPAKRFMDEEKRRLQSTREELGDSSGGKRVDFESGKITINRKDTEDTEDTEDGEDTEGADADAGAANGKANGKPHGRAHGKAHGKAHDKAGDEHADDDATAGLTPAQIRAAQRRGRLPR